MAGIGAALLTGRLSVVRPAVVIAIAFCLATWVLVQDLGFFGWLCTDPNSMLPQALLRAAGWWRCPGQRRRHSRCPLVRRTCLSRRQPRSRRQPASRRQLMSRRRFLSRRHCAGCALAARFVALVPPSAAPARAPCLRCGLAPSCCLALRRWQRWRPDEAGRRDSATITRGGTGASRRASIRSPQTSG